MNTFFLIYPIFIFLCFNSKELIILMFGDKYQESATIFFIFNFTLLIRVNDYSDILIAANHTKKIFFYYIISLCVNLILNFFLIKYLGILGAAIGTVFSIGLLGFLQLQESLKIINAKLLDLVNLKDLIFFCLGVFVIASCMHFLFLLFSLEGFIKTATFLLFYSISILILFFKTSFIEKQIIFQILPGKVKEVLGKYGFR